MDTLRPEPIVAAQIAGTAPSGTSEAPPEEEAVDAGKTWFYDLLPVVANLDEPGATRYIRTTLTLEIFDSLDKDEGENLLEKKAPHMRNWLTIYLASLTLDDARGENNLKRIQSHVLEEFNQMLFPNEKPQVSHILLKDFAIQ
ncbi:MAG: flagellar basal body-associated FliL family protein [Planctomycetes bacterium]|nr:flagellar basal body-associated FliL family protein [Planctomycetota bacterium]